MIRVLQLKRNCAGRVVVERRIETKHVTVERRSLGFDTFCYSTYILVNEPPAMHFLELSRFTGYLLNNKPPHAKI
ncbi:hypothetical protein ACFL6S_35185 [Candidatus Poribacteria bacterium]